MKIREKSIKTSTNIELIVVVVVNVDKKQGENINKVLFETCKKIHKHSLLNYSEGISWKILFNGNDWKWKPQTHYSLIQICNSSIRKYSIEFIGFYLDLLWFFISIYFSFRGNTVSFTRFDPICWVINDE